MNLDRDKLWVESIPLGFGWQQFTCFSREANVPVGFAWCQILSVPKAPGNTKLRRAELLKIWTLPAYRRNGVATKIHESIFSSGTDVIVTAEGSGDGGMVLLKRLGYKLDNVTGFWVLVKSRFKQFTKVVT
jgi:hypothetical protein